MEDKNWSFNAWNVTESRSGPPVVEWRTPCSKQTRWQLVKGRRLPDVRRNVEFRSVNDENVERDILWRRRSEHPAQHDVTVSFDAKRRRNHATPRPVTLWLDPLSPSSSINSVSESVPLSLLLMLSLLLLMISQLLPDSLLLHSCFLLLSHLILLVVLLLLHPCVPPRACVLDRICYVIASSDVVLSSSSTPFLVQFSYSDHRPFPRLRVPCARSLMLARQPSQTSAPSCSTHRAPSDRISLGFPHQPHANGRATFTLIFTTSCASCGRLSRHAGRLLCNHPTVACSPLGLKAFCCNNIIVPRCFRWIPRPSLLGFFSVRLNLLQRCSACGSFLTFSFLSWHCSNIFFASVISNCINLIGSVIALIIE